MRTGLRENGILAQCPLAQRGDGAALARVHEALAGAARYTRAALDSAYFLCICRQYLQAKLPATMRPRAMLIGRSSISSMRSRRTSGIRTANFGRCIC